MSGSPVPSLRNSYGAAFIGVIVTVGLYGLTLTQTWMYYWYHRNRDPMAVKLFIAFVAIMDTLHTILCSFAVYWYLVLNFGNFKILDDSMWAMNLQIIIGTVVGAAVQIYYARRVYRVSQNIICPILIVVLVALGSIFAIFFTTKQISLKHFSKLQPLFWIPCVGMGASALADLLIAAAMCWTLYSRRTGFARTDSIIITLMTYSINTGLLTSLLAIASTISFVVSSASMVWLAFLWVMVKCQVNSLLALLNSRDHVRDRSRSRTTTDKPPDNAINLSSIRVDPLNEAYGSKSRQAGVAVTVHRATTSDSERDRLDRKVDPTSSFGIAEEDTTIIPFQHSFPMPRSNVGVVSVDRSTPF